MKKTWAWAFYDFANSTYSTTIIAGFFPVFFKEYWSQGTDFVLTTARLGTLTSFFSLLIAVASPFLGALADLRGRKKFFTGLFTVIGALSTIGLYQLGVGEWQLAALFFGIGNIGFYAGCNFYDSLLPSVSNDKNSDWVSSLGYSMGYLGGGLLFAINVAMYLKPQLFGIENAVQAVKLSFLTVGIWWILFSIPLFIFVPEPQILGAANTWPQAFKNSFKLLKETALEIKVNKNILFLLLAYWFYIDGVYTTMNMAVDFGISLGFAASDLISALLIVQFVGFPFALLFAKFADRFGSIAPILFCLIVYCLVLYLASQMTAVWHFYVLATIIGTVQGGVQALSRSLFSRMIPAEKSGEYFGFFNLIGKFASILGPLLVGWSTLYFQSHRLGLLSNALLVVLGAVLLTQVKTQAAQK